MDSAGSMIRKILAWTEEHTNFNTTFVESVKEQYETRGRLTDAQMDALANIIDRWEID